MCNRAFSTLLCLINDAIVNLINTLIIQISVMHFSRCLSGNVRSLLAASIVIRLNLRPYQFSGNFEASSDVIHFCSLLLKSVFSRFLRSCCSHFAKIARYWGRNLGKHVSVIGWKWMISEVISEDTEVNRAEIKLLRLVQVLLISYYIAFSLKYAWALQVWSWMDSHVKRIKKLYARL